MRHTVAWDVRVAVTALPLCSNSAVGILPSTSLPTKRFHFQAPCPRPAPHPSPVSTEKEGCSSSGSSSQSLFGYLLCVFLFLVRIFWFLRHTHQEQSTMGLSTGEASLGEKLLDARFLGCVLLFVCCPPLTPIVWSKGFALT